jgi:pimeloyl-ACP methyl ester carboxylesterase
VGRRAVVLALAAAIVALVPVTRHVARRFLFRTDRAHASAPPRDAELVATTARDGAIVHALELPARPGAPMVVHFHNNSETVVGPIALARALHARGLGVMLVEYRGYGASGSGPAPDEAGLYRDAAAALDWLAARGFGPSRVILSGMSLGTGVAVEMARRGRGSALVLFSPYTSIPDLVTDRVPFLPARFLVPDRFETLAKTRSIDVPTVVIHGDADGIVPFWMGQRVASSIRGARLVRVRGGHHGDLFARDPAEIVDAILRVASLVR